MKKMLLLLCLGAATGFTACSGEQKPNVSAETPAEATAGDTSITTLPADNTATAAADTAMVADSLRHAHMHKSAGMVHNHEHAHPAADTAHRGQ